MIRLSNGHQLDHLVASGALAFDGEGWPWEKPLVALGLIEPKLFTVVLKTLTRAPRIGNLRWSRPWSCVRLIPGGSVNKVGLTNPGLDWWIRDVAPKIDFKRRPTIVSIFGDTDELVDMAVLLNAFDLAGLEVNPSCPNTGHDQLATDAVIEGVRAVKAASRHPIVVKVSVAQDYRAIARGLAGMAEAVSFNSVPWEFVYPDRKSPLQRLQRTVGGGGGGISGVPAQPLNWRAVREVAADQTLPVIAPSIMDFSDIAKVRALGARAVSYGAIHFRTPWKPTQLVRRDLAERRKTVQAERRVA
jgi:dihydroorotate dehydrogenase (NAD+) catalytic subunit